MPVMRFEASIIPLRVPLALKLELERLGFKTTRERLIERVLEGQNDRQTIETRAMRFIVGYRRS